MTRSAPDARDALAQMSVTSPLHTASVHNNTNGANTSAASPDAVTLNTPEFEAFVADVAARIIQTYWRKALARRAATAASEPHTGPRSAPPMPYCGPEPSSLPPFETAGLEGDHCQPVATSERELSTNSLENIEALMNRYRKDEPSVGAAKRSNQDAMHHAVSILRAAGMPVDGSPQTQRGVVSDCEGQGPTGAELSCTISHTVKSANKSNSVECTRRSNAADTILETTSTSAERPSASGHPARRWNVRERISGLRAGSINASHLERNEKHVQCAHGRCENTQASFNTLPQAPFNTSPDHSGVDVGMEQEHAAADHCGGKLNSILEYLDTVSQQADEEAALVVGTGSSHMSACSSSRHHRPPSEFLVTRPSMRTPDPVSLPRTLEAALAEHVEANSAPIPSNGKCAQGENVATGSFCEEVRSRMQKLQQEMQGREKTIASLNVQIQALQSAHSEQSKAMKVSHDAELSAQKKESEAALKRHLDLIDRLLADKDALSHQLDDAKDQLGSLEARHDDTVAAMKAGWALELRRQKDGWAAAEKSKREGWLADKTKEIKDATIKGLEPEIQSLVQKHRKEMAELKESFQNDNKRQMDSLREQQETHVRQLRERMLHDREVAVEGERSAAQKRLSDAAERYEASAQQARMHLVADHDRRLGEAEDAWRMHRRELQDKVKQLEQLCHDLQDGKSAAVREALDEERQKHNKAVKALKDEYDAENQAWRGAIAEKARKQLADKESQLRTALGAERDQQIELVIQKFDAEMAAKHKLLVDDHAKEVADLKAQHEVAMSQARGSQQRYSERHREASTALQAAQDRADAAQDQVKYLKDTIADKDGQLSHLEQQVQALRQDTDGRLHAQEQKLADQHAATEKALEKSQAELASTWEQLTQARAEKMAMAHRQSDEMDRVEDRVKAAIQRKDDTIESLRSQLTDLQTQMRNAESILTLE